MTRKEKCELFYEKGFRYNPETGEINGPRGKVITSKHTKGYINLGIGLNGKHIKLYGHQFAWWSYYGEIHEGDELVIDHGDQDKTNNKISNLKLKTQLENQFNSQKWENHNGYYFHKPSGKWKSYIWFEGKKKHLGYFDTEKEAREAYLTALAYYFPDRYKILEEKGLLYNF
jgi:hypothetical protein